MGMFTKIMVGILILSFFFVLFGIAQPSDGLLANILTNPKNIFTADSLKTFFKNILNLDLDGSGASSFFWGALAIATVVTGVIMKRDELIYIPAAIALLSGLGVYSILTSRLPAPLDHIVIIILYIITIFSALEWARGKD